MKGKRKLIIALSLIFVLALVFSACDNTKDEPDKATDKPMEATEAPTEAPTEVPSNLNMEGFPIVNDTITLKAFQYELENQDIDFGELWFYQELEAKTNIHVEFEEVKGPDFETKMNLMFASGDYSDLIIRGMNGTHIEEYGVTQGLLLALDDYLDTYMPIYAERLPMNNANAAIPSSDGKMYYIGALIAQDVSHQGTTYMNTTWLDTLGLEMPTTIDELTEVFRAFKTGDPNGNGKADDWAMSATFDNQNQDTTQNLLNMFASFGVPENYYWMFIDEDDSVKFTGYEAGYRACLEWLALTYDEGLLDPETLTQDSNIWGTKTNDNQVGFTWYLRRLATAWSEETAAMYEPIVPIAADGYEVKVSALLELPEFGAAVTSSNENIEATLRWLDAQMETETMMVAANGPINAGGPIDPTIELQADGKYNVLYVPENNGLYQVVPVIAGQFFAPGEYYSQIYQMPPHRLDRWYDSQLYQDAGVNEYKSFHYLTKLSKLTGEQATEITKIQAELMKYMKEAIVDFIRNGVTDDSWAKFEETTAGIGVDRYIEVYQEAYDKYLSMN